MSGCGSHTDSWINADGQIFWVRYHAHRKNGDRCKNAARRNACDFHGAKAPQVKRTALQRIEEAADRMAYELLKMATNDKVADSVKLAAFRDALDRAGPAARAGRGGGGRCAPTVETKYVRID
jgi:catalase